MNVTEKAKKFISEYYFSTEKMKSTEELKRIIKKQEFDIFMFGEHEEKRVTALIKKLDLEDKRDRHAFTYNSKKLRAIFLQEGLSDNEYAMLLMHEEAHVFLGHLNENKKDTSIYDEQEAYAFIEEIKRQLDIKEKEVKIYENVESSVPVVQNEDTKPIKNIQPKNIVIAVLIILIFIIFAKYYIDYNKFNQQLEPLETVSTTTITTVETTSNTVAETTVTTLDTTTTETETATSIETTETSQVEESNVSSDNSTVYITKSGKKYHRADCYMIASKDVIALDISEAEKLYEPCSVCRPDVY